MTDRQRAILEVIHTGDREHPVTRDQIKGRIAPRFHIHVRDVQAEIDALLAEGNSIISSNHGRSPLTGYWVAIYACDAPYVRTEESRLRDHGQSEIDRADLYERIYFEIQGRERPQPQQASLFA